MLSFPSVDTVLSNTSPPLIPPLCVPFPPAISLPPVHPAFPSSKLPSSIEFVPIDDSQLATVDKKKFKVHLIQSNTTVPISPDVDFAVSPSEILDTCDCAYVNRAATEAKPIRMQNETHKMYYTPVLSKEKIVGVLIGRREIDEPYEPNPSSKLLTLKKSYRRESMNTMYVTAFEGETTHE